MGHFDRHEGVSGFLYIARNDGHAPDIYKVGYTTLASVSQRMRSLNVEAKKGGAAVFGEYFEVHCMATLNSRGAEKIAHKTLNYCRYDPAKEIFKAPLHDIMAAVDNACMRADAAAKERETRALQALAEDRAAQQENEALEQTLAIRRQANALLFTRQRAELHRQPISTPTIKPIPTPEPDFQNTQPQELNASVPIDEPSDPTVVKEPWYVIYGPVIIGIVMSKLFGALGVLVALGVYYAAKPKTGAMFASILAVSFGTASVLVAADQINPPQPTTWGKSDIEVPKPSLPKPAPPQARPAVQSQPPKQQPPTQAEKDAALKQQQANRQAAADLDERAARAVADYPYLDTPAGAETLQKIIDYRDEQIRGGTYPALALTRAVNKFAPGNDPRGLR